MKITITPLTKFEKEVNSLIENRALLKDDYQEDLSEEQKKELKTLVTEFKRESK